MAKELQEVLNSAWSRALGKTSQVVDPAAVAPAGMPTPRNTAAQAPATPAPVAPDVDAVPAAEPTEAPAYDPMADVAGAVSQYTTAPGTLGKGYEGFQSQLLQNPQLRQHYAEQLGEGATEEQIANAAMQSYFDAAPSTIEDLAARQAQLLRMSRAGPYQQPAQEALARLPEQLRPLTKEWAPEQWEEYRGQVRQSMADPETLQALEAAGFDVIEEARKGVEEGAETAAGDIARQTIQGVVENPNSTGFTDWLKENWQTALLPAGLIAFAFGGNIGKVLGTMAMAAGGYNLYERYNRLTNPENKYHAPTLEAIRTAANQTDQEGNPAPFSDLESAAEQVAQRRGNEELAPVLKSSLTDYTFLAGHGFMDQIRQNLGQVPQQMSQSLFGPQQQQQSQTQNVAEGVWQRARDMAGRATGAVDRFLVPGGKG